MAYIKLREHHMRSSMTPRASLGSARASTSMPSTIGETMVVGSSSVCTSMTSSSQLRLRGEIVRFKEEMKLQLKMSILILLSIYLRLEV
jgi:hypothetical protein